MAYYYKDENGNMQIGSSVPDTDNGTADWNIEEEKSGGTARGDFSSSEASDKTHTVSNSSTGSSNNVAETVTLNSENKTVSESNELVEKMMTKTLTGIEAIPYQFMPSVDTRLDKTGRSSSESKIGRKYAEKITTRLPLLFLTPCFPKALSDFSDDDKNSLINMILDGTADEDLVNGSGRYYSVSFAYDEYYRYLNCMLAAVASFLNIYDKPVPGYSGGTKKLGEFDWSKESESNEDLKTFYTAKENVVFYLDGFSSVSESFTNEVTESSIASQINGTSDTAHELNFLLAGNNSALAKIAETAESAVGTITSALSDVIGDLGGGIIGSLADKGVNTIANGGKIIFPQIWSNSSYQRSYTLDIKLRSPDHDSLSIFYNILKPYCKILCLCLPRVMENESHYNANAYMSPFLVKAFSKGMFNIDMGIISSLSVTKGAECQWNADGLPTQLDISIDVTDLYSSLAMSGFESTGLIGNPFKATKQIVKIVNNTAYMDFLANMAGLNVGQMAIGRRIEMFTYLARTATTQFAARKYTQFEQSLSTLMASLYDKL